MLTKASIPLVSKLMTEWRIIKMVEQNKNPLFETIYLIFELSNS